MSEVLRQLGRPALQGLAQALRAGHVAPPYATAALAHHVPGASASAIAAELTEMTADGMAARHIARCLELLAAERAETQRMTDRIQLVWSPPELDHVDSRDTVVVVQDLFAQAQQSVLVVSYALDSGSKAKALFGKLAERMDTRPALSVRARRAAHATA